MTDKVQKIREEVEKKLEVMQYQVHRKDAYKELKSILNYMDSLQEEPVSKKKLSNSFNIGKDCKEEPVSEDLEEACEQLAENARKHKAETSSPFFSQTDYIQGVMDGAKWKVENLWKPADGDDLPEIDREVIALKGIVDQTATDCLCGYEVIFAHRPSEHWDGKNIDTGKVTRYYPKTYGKGGWNIPNIVYWLDVELPKEIEL